MAQEFKNIIALVSREPEPPKANAFFLKNYDTKNKKRI
jgi:hypothetical protein